MSRYTPGLCPEDWVPCPTCRGEGYIATEVSYEQRSLSRGAPPLRLVCPTCGTQRRVLAPICERCFHLPGACTCSTLCVLCRKLGHFLCRVGEQYAVRCRAHLTDDSTELRTPTQGAYRIARYQRQCTAQLKAGEIVPHARAKARE